MTDPVPVLSDDDRLAQIRARQAERAEWAYGEDIEFLLSQNDALCATVRALRAELERRERTMKFWEQSYLAEHETWGDCQWKAENITLRERLEEMNKSVSESH